MADEIKIELVLDSDGVVKGLKKVETEAEATGQRTGDNFSKGISAKSAIIAGAVTAAFTGAAVVAAAKVKDIVFDGIEAARAQEDAIQKLNASLRNTGNFSEATSKSLQNFASSLQASTVIGDEVILDQLAFAQAMGASVDQSQSILKAAADMSSALGIDLNSAVRNISKTLGGYAGELGEVIPELKTLTKEQLMNGEGIDLLASRYAGFASAEAKTFSGAITQLQNIMGDLSEKVGENVVRNDQFISLITAASNAVSNFIARADFSFVAKGLMGLVNLGLQATKVFAGLGSFIGMVTGSESLKKFSFDIKATIAEIQTAMELQRLAQDNMALKQEEVATRVEISDERIKVASLETSNAIVANNEVAKESAESLAKSVEGSMFDITNNVNSALGAGVRAGVQSLIGNLTGAEKGFDGFAKAVFGILGNLATQIGETLLLTGLGLNAVFSLSGAAAVAAGIGLIALGSILSSFAGDGGGGTSVSPTSPTGDTTATPTVGGPVGVTDMNEPESREKQQQVQLVIHGDVLDSQETGTKLIRLLNENFESSGSKLITA